MCVDCEDMRINNIYNVSICLSQMHVSILFQSFQQNSIVYAISLLRPTFFCICACASEFDCRQFANRRTTWTFSALFGLSPNIIHNKFVAGDVYILMVAISSQRSFDFNYIYRWKCRSNERGFTIHECCRV